MSALFDKDAVVDVEMVQKANEAEKIVSKEMPNVRDAELLAREVFSQLAAQSGDPADRRNVEKAWVITKGIVEVYLTHSSEIKALHELHKQRKIRVKLLLS